MSSIVYVGMDVHTTDCLFCVLCFLIDMIYFMNYSFPFLFAHHMLLINPMVGAYLSEIGSDLGEGKGAVDLLKESIASSNIDNMY